MLQLEKVVTVRKMCNNQENMSQLEKCAQLDKQVTVRKMCHSEKNVSQIERCVKVAKMCHK